MASGDGAERRAKAKILSVLIKTAWAVPTAAGDEQRNSHARAVGNVRCLDRAVVHKCSTLSAISWVLP